MLVLAIALLFIVANGSPLLMANLLGSTGNWPIDGDRRFTDGRPLFGATKTWRGLLSSLLLTSLVAWLLGVGWLLGLMVAAGAMAGDLLSSFTKRRMGLASSAKAPGLDQLPESLIPAVLLYALYDVSGTVLLIAVALFVFVDVAVSPLLFRWGLRRVPH